MWLGQLQKDWLLRIYITFANVIINTSVVNVWRVGEPGELRYQEIPCCKKISVLPVPLELVFNEPPSNWPRLFR